MLGWIQNNGENVYSEDQVYHILCSTKTDTSFQCCKFKPISDKEKAKRYLMKIEIVTYGYIIILVSLILVGAFIILINMEDDTDDLRSVFYVFFVIKTCATIPAAAGLTHFGMFVSTIPAMKDYQIMNKFNFINASILLTEAQPTFIALFASWGLIADTGAYDEDTTSDYANALLLCSEIMILSFIMFLVFPLTDYDVPTYMKEIPESTTKEE